MYVKMDDILPELCEEVRVLPPNNVYDVDKLREFIDKKYGELIKLVEKEHLTIKVIPDDDISDIVNVDWSEWRLEFHIECAEHDQTKANIWLYYVYMPNYNDETYGELYHRQDKTEKFYDATSATSALAYSDFTKVLLAKPEIASAMNSLIINHELKMSIDGFNVEEHVTCDIHLYFLDRCSSIVIDVTPYKNNDRNIRRFKITCFIKH